MSQEIQEKSIYSKTESGVHNSQSRHSIRDKAFHPLDNWYQFQSRRCKTDKTKAVQTKPQQNHPE